VVDIPRIPPPPIFSTLGKLLTTQNLFFFPTPSAFGLHINPGPKTNRKEDCGMLTKKLCFRKYLILSVPLCLATYVGAQSTPSQNPTRDNDIETSPSSPDRDINYRDLSSFNKFLEDHREIAEQLRRDPSLADNKKFLKNHPELQNFLRQNPQIRDGLKDNANGFMSAETRFERNEYEVANFDRFLDTHRNVAAELTKNPSLADNQRYLKDHPELQSYLQDHPEIRERLEQNPNAFMNEEVRWQQSGGDRDRNVAYDRDRNNGYGNGVVDDDHGDRNNDRRDIASFDRFLDSHPEISEQLQKQPSLADNKQFLKEHPALQSYLQQNPAVRERLEQNPTVFMDQEARWEHSGDGRVADQYARYDQDRNNNYSYNRDRDNRNDYDRDRDAHQHFGEFLGAHQDIAADMANNPSLCKDHDYLQTHPELQDYLNTHPEVRQPLTSDPNTFMTQQFNSNGQSGQTGKMPAPATTQPGSAAQPKPNKQ
jgi:hypothetical protein